MTLKALLELGSSFVARSLSAAGVLLISIILSRQLNLSETGTFFAAFTLLMGLAIFCRVGQELRLLRSVATKKDGEGHREDLLSSSLITIAASGVIAVVIFSWWLWSERSSPLTLLWVPLIPVALLNIASSYLKGIGSGGLGALSELGGISLIVSCYFLWSPQRTALNAWLVFCLVSWFVAVAWCVVAYIKAPGAMRVSHRWRNLITDARHLWAVALLSYLAQWGAMILVTIILAQDSVAVMNVLLRLLAPLQFVVLTLDYFLAPRFAHGTKGSILRARFLGIVTGLAIAFPYGLVLMIWPSVVLGHLFGSDYAAFGLELRLLIGATMLQMAFGANGMLLNMLSKDRAMTNSVILRLVVNTVLQFGLFLAPFLWMASLAHGAALMAQAIYLRMTADRFIGAPKVWAR